MKRLISKAKYTINFGKVYISPGENILPPDAFESVSSHPKFSSRITTGIFNIPVDESSVSCESDGMNESFCSTFKTKVKEIIGEIEKIDDIIVLKEIQESDDRPRVLKAIEKRLEELKEG